MHTAKKSQINRIAIKNSSSTNHFETEISFAIPSLFGSLIVVVSAFSRSLNKFLASARIFVILSSKMALLAFVGTFTLQ